MQKKIIALAIAGLASTAAFAQSNVTIYGVADATFDNVRSTGADGVAVAVPALGNGNVTNTGPNAVTGNPTGTVTRATSANDYHARNRVTANSSYIGFKGVEDLGNGLKAVFQVESGLAIDNGGTANNANTGGQWANRDSFVGAAGAFGTIVAGNLTGPTRALGAKLDINNGATGIGANAALLGKLGGGSGAGAFDQRITNAIAYVSPTVAGFNGVLGYSTGLTNGFAANTTLRSVGLGAQGAGVIPAAGLLAGQESSGTNVIRGNHAWTGGLNYEAGPAYVGYAFTRVQTSSDGAGAVAGNAFGGASDGLVSALDKVSNHRLGAIYKIGSVAQVGLMWDRTGAVTSDNTKIHQNVYYVSGKFFVGNGAVIGQVGRAGNLVIDGDKFQDTGAMHYALGYEHNLSKRTALKAIYSRINNNQFASYDYLYGVSAANTTGSGAGLAGTGGNVSGFSVGVRHAF